MEKVDITKALRENEKDLLPKWTRYVDCQQVGYTADGRLVAYDFAS